ncbi:hypothetical protein [Stenotrophomonas sp. YIM B06876]|nr:hypothetical protein [Stenotrophomonas sp. YIM B06876]
MGFDGGTEAVIAHGVLMVQVMTEVGGVFDAGLLHQLAIRPLSL